MANGITLKAARVNVNLTQKQAAKRLGIAESTLSLYERGELYPTIKTIQKMEELYGLSYNDINFCPNNTV